MARSTAPTRPLHALLSQVLVAYTIEADGQFERAMLAGGYPGAHLSLLLWFNVMRLVGDGIGVRDLARAALAPEEHIKHELGCLERWGFVTLEEPDHGSDLKKRVRKRDGWGSGQGVRADWIVRLTEQGAHARLVWPKVLKAVDANWRKRLGAETSGDLRNVLTLIVASHPDPLPDALPMADLGAGYAPPRRKKAQAVTAPKIKGEPGLAPLLSKALLMFAIAFDRGAPAPIEFCANLLRVLADGPVRVSELALRTGLAPECADIGWQEKRLVVLSPAPEGRGKVAALSDEGRAGLSAYAKLVPSLEADWEARFGKADIGKLRKALLIAFDAKNGSAPIAEALVAPAQTARAGVQVAALGRLEGDVGPAAVKRGKELVAQTNAFLADPATLPHFPRWDRNRGFGP